MFARGAFLARMNESFRKAAVLAVVACLSCMSMVPEAAAQSVFTVQSVPNPFTGTFVDSEGRTITVRAEPQDSACVSISQAGRVTGYARSSVPACDRTLTFDFEAVGFLVESITFSDMDDLDGTGPRDSYAMNVPGTWTSPTIEVYSFASPPVFADQIGRLISAGAVGSFIANESGSNPVDETATFTMATPTGTFRMLFDDSQALRDAQTFFDLDNMVIVIAPGFVSAANDSGSIAIPGGGVAIANVRANDVVDGVAANSSNSVLTIAPGSSLPDGFTLDQTTGSVTVAAGTAVGAYAFDYRICVSAAPANCATAKVDVTVTGEIDLGITKTNTPGQNNNVDLPDDGVTAGSATTYTIAVANLGANAVNGAVITDTPGAGLTCDAATPVTITGDGVPAGSFTIADLTGPGITLDTLAAGQSVTLTYSCQVN